VYVQLPRTEELTAGRTSMGWTGRRTRVTSAARSPSTRRRSTGPGWRRGA
jgi:hypothetical protein